MRISVFWGHERITGYMGYLKHPYEPELVTDHDSADYSMDPRARGHSHMSVDIKCLSLDPFFYADLAPNDPLFLFSPPNDPQLFDLCIKFYMQLHISGSSNAFWEI